MVELKVAAIVGLLSSGGLVAQALPGIPADFKTWPVTAMLAFLVFCSLALCYFIMKSAFAHLTKATEALVKVSDAQTQTNSKLDDVAKEMRVTNLNLAGRPCISEAHNRH